MAGMFRVVATTLVLAGALTGCGHHGASAPPATPGQPGATASTSSGQSASPSAPQTSPTPPASQVQASVYLLRDGKLTPVPRTVAAPAVTTNAIRALLAGARPAEQGATLFSAVPTGVTLYGVSLRDRVATVDLSSQFGSGGGSFSMGARVAQVVFTATRQPGVDKVRFWLDHKPVTSIGGEGLMLDHPMGRADFESFAPAVLVESPRFGETVRGSVRATGSANVFEAVFRLELADSAGKVVADVPGKASSGTGTRGVFDVTFPYHGAARTGPGKLTAYYLSAKDGSRVVAAVTPVTVAAAG